MTSNMTSPGQPNSIVIIPDDSSLSLAQAIYHHVTNKTETLSQSFKDRYSINEEEIFNLIHILKQTAQRHHEGEWSCVIDHSLFKGSRTRYSSLERFKVVDKGQSEPTSEVVITYDFLSKNPYMAAADEIRPERYKIVVYISQEPYLALVDEEDSRPSFLTRLMTFPSINVKINYVDYTIARALLSAVKDWVAALETQKQSKISNIIRKNELSIHSVIPTAFAACIFIGSSGLAGNLKEAQWSFLLASMALAVLFYGFGSLISELLMVNIYKTVKPTTINITRGDANNISLIEKKISRSKAVIGFIFVTVVAAIFINVFSSFIYSWLAK